MKSARKLASIVVVAATVGLTVSVRDALSADDIQSEIEAANKVFVAAFTSGDAAAVANCYTPNAQVFAAGMDVVTGTPAIEAYWKAGMQGGVERVTLTTLEAEEHGDTAIEVGRAELFNAGGDRIDQLKYIVIWKRIDGAWKLHRDIFNTNLAAAQ